MLQVIANGLCNSAAYSLVAVGFGLIFFTSRTFHIAHGAVFITAGFACYSVLVPLGLPLAISVIIGVVAGTALGLLIETLVYYPLINQRKTKRASSAVSMISSLGTYIVVVNTIAILAGNETKVLFPGVGRTLSFSGIILTYVQIVQLTAAAILLILLAIILRMTYFGRTMRALADDPELVSILGHNVRLLRIGVFAVGSALASIGSILVAFDIGINPQAGFHAVLMAAVATIVGGFGRILAPALGALILGLLQSLVVWKTSQKWSSLVVFAVLIVVLLIRPHGILATAKRLEER